MKRMRKACGFFFFLAMFTLLGGFPCRAQSASATGAIEFDARVTPTAARPEPVRLFTFYLLSKSYAEIADEAVDIPEFQDAYMTANTGGLAPGMPRPKYSEALKTSHPAKYERLRQQYITALKKFVAMNPGTLAGIEAYLDAVNPARGWNQLAAAHRNRMARQAPEIAQTRYLVAKTDTDLNGHGSLLNVPPGMYWLSTLNLNAAAADLRLRWNVEVTVQPGRTTRIELTNLNGTEPSQAAR